MTAAYQLDLLTAQTIGAPYNGTSTSIAAAIAVADKVTPRQQLILGYLAEHGPSTQDEIAAGVGLPVHSVNPRVNELWHANKIHETGERRLTRLGCSAVVWALGSYAPSAAKSVGTWGAT